MRREETQLRHEVVRLWHADREVAEYVWQSAGLPRHVSPRPFLHPVRTLAGTPVTDLMPGDHHHHLGASIAVPDLAGHNFWGGRTFVRAHGPVPLDNHGTQRHDGWISRSPGTIVAALAWAGADGTVLLHEHRRMATVPLAPDCWALDLSFELTNVTTGPLSFASPATNGRPGAGYGGFFWRAPHGAAGAVAFGPSRRGVRHLHGKQSDWLAVSATACPAGDSAQPAARPAVRWTLIFVPADERTRADPWFVRTGDYVGVGSCLAWDRPLIVGVGDTLRRRIITVVADGALAVGRAAQLAAAAAAHAAGTPGTDG